MSTNPVAGANQHERPLVHEGLVYRDAADYLAGVLPYIRSGLAAGQPVFVAVPASNLELIQKALGKAGAAVTFADMRVVGRNPARIIPAIRRFVDAHPGERVRFVGEPIWAGRSPAEIDEATHHEALLNTAFADTDLDILCPYDVSTLDPAVISDAWCTHPVVVDGAPQDSGRFDEPGGSQIGYGPLAEPPPSARSMPVEPDDLCELRDFVRGRAAGLGLTSSRIQDLVLAMNEIATNTLVHTKGVGCLTIWQDGRSVVCEIRDSGHIADPLVGRHLPDRDDDHGRGVWMANQLCDLVQLRSSEAGTTIRLHVADV